MSARHRYNAAVAAAISVWLGSRRQEARAMSFTADIKDEAFARSQGRCECRRPQHAHKSGRCHHTVDRHGAQYHPVEHGESAGVDTVKNCRVLCAHCRVRGEA